MNQFVPRCNPNVTASEKFIKFITQDSILQQDFAIGLKDSRFFIFKHYNFNCTIDESLDLPFEHCFFEHLSTGLTPALPNPGYLGKFTDAQFFHVIGIYANESSPGVIEIIGCIELSTGQIVPWASGMADHPYSDAIWWALENSLRVLKEGRIFKAQGERIRTKINKQVIKINDIIYVGRRNDKTCISRNGRTLEYSHHFEVRGHWRKFDGLGKNREGNRTVPGHTWVRSYEKGDKEAPLIKKIRIVQ